MSVRGKGGGKNTNFFQQNGCSVTGKKDQTAAKVSRAYQRCAETGVLNLSDQNLSGELPASVCSFGEDTHHENWWEQCPVSKIDISNNRLTLIPSSIGNLLDCTSFVAQSNELQAIPYELVAALPLKQLNLKRNQIAVLPGDAFSHAEHLVELVLAQNQLSDVPTEVFSIPSLEVLDVEQNRLSYLPDNCQWACSRLQRLNMSKNRVGPQLPNSIRRCTALRELNASANCLEDLGDMFVADGNHPWRRSLVMLDLSLNKLGIKGVIRISNLEALDTLSIASNRIGQLELGAPFTKLTTFIADTNRIGNFPVALLHGSAPALATLDFANNDLNALPPELGLSTALKRVALEGNPMRTIRPEMLRGGAEKLKAHLRSRIEGPQGGSAATDGAEGMSGPSELDIDLRTAVATHELKLSGRGLKALPLMPPGLRVLQIDSNDLTGDALVAAFAVEGDGEENGPPMETLRQLSAARNSIAEGRVGPVIVPYLVRNFPLLQDWNLSRNGLASSGGPDAWARVRETGNGRSLTRVDLSGNALTAIPTDLLLACPALNEIKLRSNRISSFDGFAGSAGSLLFTLDLEENIIQTAVPWLPTALPQLKTLMLANNAIGPTLPPQWGFWESVQAVTLNGNPLRSMRQSLVAKGWPSVAQFLRDKLEDGDSQTAEVPVFQAEIRPCQDMSGGCRSGDIGGRSDARNNSPAGGMVRRPSDNLGPGFPSHVRSSSGANTPDPYAAVPPRARPPSGFSSARCSSSGGSTTPVLHDARPVQAAVDGSPSITDDRLARLRQDVQAMENELSSPGINRSRQSTLSHSLRMKRGELLKIERELKRQMDVAGNLNG